MNDVVDDTQVNVNDDGSSVKPDEAAIAAQKTQEELNTLLEEEGFESLEGLTEALTNQKEYKEKLGNITPEKLQEIAKKANTLDTYNAYWAAEDNKKRLDNMEPDDRIHELESENKQLRLTKTQEEGVQKEAQELTNAIAAWDTEIIASVDQEDATEAQKEFVKGILGPDNPTNSLTMADLTSKKAVNKAVKDAITATKKFADAIIKDYRDGKYKAPDITSTDNASPVPDKTKIKSMADAHKIFREIMTKK